MAGLVIHLLLSTVIVAIHGQRTKAEPCWNRTVHTDDVLVVCRLEEDVSKTHHGIALVPSDKETKRLLVCGWNGARCPKVYSDYGVYPLGDLTDLLIARVPADQSDGDSYKYQLIPPPDGKDPYTECEVIRPRNKPLGRASVTQETPDENMTSTIPNVTQQTTTDARASTARKCVDGESGHVFGLVVTAIVLLFVILAAIFAIGIFLYFNFSKFTRNTEIKAGGRSSNMVEIGDVCDPLKSDKVANGTVGEPLLEKTSETSLDSGLSA